MSINVFDLVAKLSLDKSEYESGLSSATSMIGKGLGTAAKIGAAAIGAATTAVVGFGAMSVKAGADFDKSMSQVAATMGLSMEEMANQVGEVDLAWGHFSGNLRDYAQEMGRNTAFSATEAADALNYMALAGYDVQTSMEMLPNVLNLAAAGNMDLARASDMVTDTQTAFGISLDRTSQMVDEMAKAASTGNTSVEQLGDAFLTVGGLAGELNGGLVTLEDGTTQTVDGVQELEIALTAMANAGVKGSEAGTHMRNMLLKLSSPTSDGAVALENLGVAVFDTEGNMRSLSDVFGDLSTSLGDLTQEEKIQAISDLFNTRDLASAEALLGAVNQDWDEIGASILDADGAAQKMADTQLDNLSGDVTLFKSALEGAKIAVSDSLTPSLREFVQFGTDGLSRLTEAFKEGGIEQAFDVLSNILYEAVDKMMDAVPKVLDVAWKLLEALGKGILDNLPILIDASVKIILQLVDYIVKALPQLVDGALQIILALADGLIQMLPELIPAIVDVIIQIVETLIDNLDLLIDAAIQIILALIEGLDRATPQLIEKMPEIVQKLLVALIKSAPLLAKGAVEFIIQMVKGWSQALPAMLKMGRDLIPVLVTAISEALPKALQVGKDIVTEISTTLDELPTKALEWGKDLIDSFVSGIKDNIGKVGDAVKSVGSTVKDFIGFSEPDKGPLSNFHTFAPDMIDLFTQGIEDGKNQVADAMADLGGVISGEITSNNIETAGGGTNDLIAYLEQFKKDIMNQQIVLDSGALVGGIANKMDNALGQRQLMARKGVIA